ncbi:hypothetical protein NQ315_007324 [Exocentrus adspersus]|uniref:DUF4485 domain-containing protein n=1 Tax=Exocentrus adspersus TaxID=1586481 RepID=A0AAV8WDL8_9CUCU|nr:hypothetical protein NQ315_007324 [Exocentrus adspersus]
MEIEAKLDEDFLFYLNFTNTFLKRLPDAQMEHKCRVWLYKLCGEPCEGIEMKRCRNIYLANLLVCMQNGVLDPPFLQSPHDIDIMNATEIFAPVPDSVEPPDWLNDTDYHIHSDEASSDKKGRTYIATRTLPNGQGAFAYVGISLTNEEPMWLGAGEGLLAQQMEEKYAEMVPPVHEMEKILARRKSPAERMKVLTFYDVLLQNIADELDGKDTTQNETVEGLLVQLVHDLTEKGMYQDYEAMEEGQKRYELLLLLFDRVKIRRDKVAKREELLDDLEEKVIPISLLQVSDIQPEDKYEFPAAMWEQAIDKIPTKKQMARLQDSYPYILIEKFLQSLSTHKEQIAMRMQRRHENIVTQMKKELRKEGEKKRKVAEDTELACENAVSTLTAVRLAYQQKMDAENQFKDKTELPTSDHTRKYEEMKAAVFDTQKLVEEEALRGKFLAAQINVVSEQTEQFMNVNQELLTKTEEANMKTMRSIKRLNAAIKQYENRILELKAQAGGGVATTQAQGTFFV